MLNIITDNEATINVAPEVEALLPRRYMTMESEYQTLPGALAEHGNIREIQNRIRTMLEPSSDNIHFDVSYTIFAQHAMEVFLHHHRDALFSGITNAAPGDVNIHIKFAGSRVDDKYCLLEMEVSVNISRDGTFISQPLLINHPGLTVTDWPIEISFRCMALAMINTICHQIIATPINRERTSVTMDLNGETHTIFTSYPVTTDYMK